MKIKSILLQSITLGAIASLSGLVMAAPNLVQLDGHVPGKSILKSVDMGRASATQTLALAIPLQPQNVGAMETLIHHLYTPGDALYSKYLTPAQFTARFAPSQQQYDQVVSYLQSQGFTSVRTNSNRLLVNVGATVAQVEKAFNVEIHRYLTSNGRNVFSTNVEPTVDAGVANLIYGVVGLNSFVTPKKYFVFNKGGGGGGGGGNPPNPPGNGPDVGGLNSTNVKTAYNMTSITENGNGQVLGLAEFDGYTLSDITTYAQNNSLGTLNLKNVYVDGFNGQPSSGMDSGAVEVTLDIQLMAAIAPGATIMVYAAPAPTTESSFETEVIDVYSKIASDNLAKAVSTSWGAAEDQVQSATMKSENTAFMQMATQGQSMYAAAGDTGAYDDGTTLSVDDPGSQPYVTSAGGTHLDLTSSLAYQSETSWNTSTVDSSNGPEGGGGGISAVWSIPTWQQGLGTSTNKGSTTMRMVPDVSLDADPASGYSMYFTGQWGVVGGTSCVGPILAGFTGLVNQARAAKSQAALGYMNPIFYQIGTGSAFSSNFHDINDNSTNLYYPAVTGYDLSTGWGSLIGTTAFTTLVGMGSSTVSN